MNHCLFSSEQTATLLAELAAIETQKGTTIIAPTSLSKEREQVQISLLQLLTFLAIVSFLWYCTILTSARFGDFKILTQFSFERRTSTESEGFSLLIYRKGTKSILHEKTRNGASFIPG